jgi:predicted DNA-binding transcriptional regulator AlpA
MTAAPSSLKTKRPRNSDRGDILPRSLPPRGISRVEAAAYVGVSPSKFDEMVGDRRMPPPRRVDGRKVWDVRELDVAFDALPYDASSGEKNSWHDV